MSRRRCCCITTPSGPCLTHANCIAGGNSTTSVYMSISGGTWSKRPGFACATSVPSLDGDYVLSGGPGYWYYQQIGIIPYYLYDPDWCCDEWSLWLNFRVECLDPETAGHCQATMGFLVYPTTYGLTPPPDLDFRQVFPYSPEFLEYPVNTSTFTFNYTGLNAGEWTEQNYMNCGYSFMFNTPYGPLTQPPATITVSVSP